MFEHMTAKDGIELPFAKIHIFQGNLMEIGSRIRIFGFFQTQGIVIAGGNGQKKVSLFFDFPQAPEINAVPATCIQ